ncbi:MAG: ATP-binding protein [Bacteroidia bacterium]|nr:ATP-binding protein [Bacteroidia bacterium]
MIVHEERTWRLRLPSNEDSLLRVVDLVDNLKLELNIPETVYGNIMITVTEAVNNAIRHGNCGDESKKVDVELRTQDDCLIVSVTDEGPGFDYTNVKDPTDPENLLSPSGRGVFIIKNFSDFAEYKGSGNRVEFGFYLTPKPVLA